MKTLLYRVSIALAIALGALAAGRASGAAVGSASAPAAGAGRCVILVSVDGLAHFYLGEPRPEMPTLRRLAREGAWAAGGMVCTFPTVTWPNHTTLVTGVPAGRHGVLGNSYLDRAKLETVTLLCDPVFDKDQVVKVPTLYDAARAAGLKSAAICWPATRNARTLDWSVPDMPGDDTWEQLGTRSWLAELREAGLPVDRHGPWVRDPAGGVQRDWLYVRMAAHALAQHAPNLLLVHLVEPDHTQHRFGPRSPEAYWCASYTDDRLRDVIEAVERSPRAGATTVVVCGDHGFLTIRRDIRPNVVLRKLGLVEMAANKPSRRSAWCVSQGGASMVYVLDDARRAEIVGRLKIELGKLDGIQAVLSPDQYVPLGQRTPADDPRAPDLWLAAQPDYSFSDVATGEETGGERASVGGTHGYLPDQPDMLAACVFWGAGVPVGKDLGKVRMIDVAPTIAHLLGVPLPGAEGKPLF